MKSLREALFNKKNLESTIKSPNPKYSFTGETINHDGHTLHRIISLRKFGKIKKGKLGGFIESEKNLSHYGNCWVYQHAYIYDDAEVYDNAKVHGYSEISGFSIIHGNIDIKNQFIKDQDIK